MFTVYVLYSSKAGKYYTGFTSDLSGRLLSHNSLGKGWTARYRPWELVYNRAFAEKSEAIKNKHLIKTGAPMGL